MIKNEAAKGCGRSHYTPERVRRTAYLPPPARFGRWSITLVLWLGACLRGDQSFRRWSPPARFTLKDDAGASLLDACRAEP